MVRTGSYFISLIGILLVGCSSSELATGEPKTEAPKTSTSSTGENKSPSTQEPNAKSGVTIGMEAADVKTLKGAPDDAKHEHGPAGAELDIWIYKDGKITFTNGKVSKIE